MRSERTWRSAMQDGSAQMQESDSGAVMEVI